MWIAARRIARTWAERVGGTGARATDAWAEGADSDTAGAASSGVVANRWNVRRLKGFFIREVPSSRVPECSHD
ncbi:hypothetical protein GCM10018793_46220 [Streptomyces sulfonofaciens]|uniref:Uncharacterized protein n=1 Tax=Streptomyces sulfonofaciens TaxID=68272 RepID=A0A919L5P9_9ACTN|nr:hypothetical protein GCM10018793_46220 [Streptomyces sulfonofaciens]